MKKMKMTERKKLLLEEKRKYGLPLEISRKEARKLQRGMPIQKVMGFINFDHLEIRVERDVLIPRYETQEVIHKALEYIKPADKVLDLCCGSGYIGLTIKKKMPYTEVVLADVSKQAIKQTKENARINNLQVEVVQSDLLRSMVEKFNVIVCNPPYIPFKYKKKLSKSVTGFEPANALFADDDGNEFYKRILSENEALRHLVDYGWIIFELSEDNVEYLVSKGFEIFNDINGKPRIGVRQFKPEELNTYKNSWNW